MAELDEQQKQINTLRYVYAQQQRANEELQLIQQSTHNLPMMPMSQDEDEEEIYSDHDHDNNNHHQQAINSMNKHQSTDTMVVRNSNKHRIKYENITSNSSRHNQFIGSSDDDIKASGNSSGLIFINKYPSLPQIKQSASNQNHINSIQFNTNYNQQISTQNIMKIQTDGIQEIDVMNIITPDRTHPIQQTMISGTTRNVIMDNGDDEEQSITQLSTMSPALIAKKQISIKERNMSNVDLTGNNIKEHTQTDTIVVHNMTPQTQTMKNVTIGTTPVSGTGIV